MAAIPKSLGVLPPFVLQYDPSNAPVVQVAVSGGGLTGPQLYDYAFNNIEPRLEGISGVASASINGGRQRQINVVVDPVRAEARRITAGDVAKAVAQSNALLPSGEFIAKGFDANVYTNAVPERVKAIGDAVMADRDGRPVMIRDVARVEDGGSPATQAVSVNGQNAVYLNVLRIPGGNTIEIVDQVKETVAHLKNLPAGVKVTPIFDQSTFVRGAYSGLKKEIVQALFLIALIILVFLQSSRGTLIVGIAIPLSFAITLIVLYSQGETLNAFTLGGLTLAMGPLVDQSVVVLESIHRHRKRGMSLPDAVLHGTNAVALAVLASVLCTVAVLLPVLLLSGLAKKLFAPLALTVAVSMIGAYAVSVCVTPVACLYLLGEEKPGRFWKKIEHAVERLTDRYVAILKRVLPHRAALIGGSVALVVGACFVAARLPSTFFPEIDESMERTYVRYAPGTSLQDSARMTNRIGLQLAKELPPGNVELVLANVGSPSSARSAMTSPNWGPYMGFIRLALKPARERTLSQQQIADLSRKILVKDFPGVDFLQAPGGLVASVFANGYIAPLVVEVRNDKLPLLDRQAKAVAEVMRTVPGVRDVRSSLDVRYPEVRVKVNREQ
ncbi:MAG TPA: efflux RND transporter permease subunit, partial [Polyangia bacterium]